MKHHHFLIISFPAQGHLNPTLQLAKNLARAGAKVTFATTIHGLTRVQDSLPTLNGLSYTTFSDGHDEETIKPSSDFIGYMADLRRAGSEDLIKILHKFMDEGQPVTCVVYTVLLPWAAVVARDMHVPSVFLSIQCATVLAIHHQFFNSHDGIHKDWNIETPVVIPKLPLFSSSDLPTILIPDNPMSPLVMPIMRDHIRELEKDTGSLVFLNTFQELEQEAIEYFEGYKLSVIGIGPLIPSAFSDGNDSTDKSFGGDLFIKDQDYVHWLDMKHEKSVVYVSFGSLVVMNKEQKVEILHGLVESKTPFLWVIRSSDNEEDEIKNMLENEVNNGDGIIVPWCSQVELLNHKSIGCFVTQCGWNSTLESLVCGVPLIGCPQFADQITNAKMIEEVWGCGVRARANGEVMIERKELKKYIEIVMGDSEKGQEIRRNALKWRDLAVMAVKDGGSTYNNFKWVLENSGLIDS